MILEVALWLVVSLHQLLEEEDLGVQDALIMRKEIVLQANAGDTPVLIMKFWLETAIDKVNASNVQLVRFQIALV